MKYQTSWKFVPMLSFFDLFGNLIFFLKKHRQMPKLPKKVLFIRLEHIGDMIMATPCFETWKKNNPKCEVHVLCKTLTSPLLKNNPYVDKIITYDAPWFIKRKEDSNKKLKEVIEELKKEKYDFVFEMHGDPRNNYLAYKTNAYSIGYDCRGGGFFLNKVVPYNPKQQMIMQNLSLIKPFCKKISNKTNIYLDKEAKKTALKLLSKHSLKEKEFIIINPMSGRPEKDLTKEEVINFIEKNKSSKIIITGSSSEKEKNKSFEKHFNNQNNGYKITNLTGETDLLTLVELVRVAKKVYAPDTGIIHIAKAVGTLFDCVYKTTDKAVWGY